MRTASPSPSCRLSLRLLPSFCLSWLAIAGLSWGLPAWAESASVYRAPPQALTDLVDRPPTPRALVSPDGTRLLLLERPQLPSIRELAEPELRLGGLRIQPHQNGPSRTRPFTGLELLEIADGRRQPITDLPEAPRLGNVSFSPDGARLAFTHTGDEGIELWVADTSTGRARQLLERPLNLAGGGRPSWLASSRELIVAVLPAGRGAVPVRSSVPAGPVIQENLEGKAPARTYQDLLGDAHDEALFEHYLAARLLRVNLDGSLAELGDAGLIWSFEPSPDGRHLLVETLHRPFSYLVPASRFPRRVEVIDLESGTAREIADLPLHESIPIAFGSVATGPRSFGWREDADATLVWAEAQDGGDAARPAEIRDQLFLLPAPYTGPAEPWVRLEKRYAGVLWGRDDLALIVEQWWQTRSLRVLRARPGEPERAAELLVDRSWEDRYNDPGFPAQRTDARGRSVLHTGGEAGEILYLLGDGASPEGDRPFLDAWDLRTGEKERLFRSAAPWYEEPLELLPEGELLVRRESVEEPPNYFVRQLGERGTEGGLRRLTSFPHPAPELKGLHKEIIRYKRQDGVELNATLYLPPGYDAASDGPLPMLMWAYPREYKSASAAGQVTDSPYRFDRVSWSSPLLWLTQGYAVLDDPKMPIVGEGEVEPNDTFRDQLVGSARAAIEEVVRRGVADPDKIAIGGHSYGAFMTANLLAHSDLFAAGIARSGAYNRTLTPFGFQSEQRSYWQAPEVYFAMSPFMHAEKVDEPILLIHGAADNNSGTFPMQSERYYNALKGHGATARLVMLPHESHGYRARESVLHVLWETHQWLDRYVKHGGEPAALDDVPSVERAVGLEDAH